MSHGNSYDHGLIGSNNPWHINRCGYNSSSPPGTASSGSSANSEQCYGRSPDELCVDSLINSLLNVVDVDAFSNCTNDLRLPSPGGFSEGRCRDSLTGECNDIICDSCSPSRHLYRSHMSPRHPKMSLENEFEVFSTLGSTTVMDHIKRQHHNTSLPSPPMMRASNSPLSSTSLYCEIHRDAQRYYCQTCSKPLCGECGIHRHQGHVTVHLMEAVEGAGAQANQVINEARLGISILREDLDNIQLAAENLDQKAREASAEVLMCVRRLTTALETREKDLLSRIEKARALKIAALHARDEGLRNAISRLTRAVDILNDAVDAASPAGNPFELLVTKDMASAEVFQVRQMRQSLLPHEENWISFTGPDVNMVQMIGNLGSVIVTNPGPIGDRRAIKNIISPPTVFQPSSSPQFIPSGTVPRGRPIPGNPFPVTVRLGRNMSILPKPVQIIGNDGETKDNLCRPWGVACDKEGNIVVADRSNNRIQIYRQDGSVVRKFGTLGTGPVEFNRPAGVAVDARRRIVVADKDNHRIQILTMEGLFLLSFGDKGLRCGQFNYPWDVATNSECQIVVSDTRNHRVQLFSPEGVFLRKYGYENTSSMWRNFDSPRGVAFNPEGCIVVTDFNNHKVLVLDADLTNARALNFEGGNGTKQFVRPQGIVIDDEGNIIIADSRNNRIQVFDKTGSLMWKFGCQGKGPNEMERPSGIALSPDGRIAVVDFGNDRVLMI